MLEKRIEAPFEDIELEPVHRDELDSFLFTQGKDQGGVFRLRFSVDSPGIASFPVKIPAIWMHLAADDIGIELDDQFLCK